MVFNQTGPNAQATIGTYIDGNQTNYTTINQITDGINIPRVQAGLKDNQIGKKIGPCFEGTRVALLKEMANRITSQGKHRMYVLSGLAGIGKSTIAYSIATWADERHLLGASFFFSRDDIDRSNANKFFTTLAYQLYRYNDEFAQAIGAALATERGSDATMGIPENQLEVLILEPLRDIAALCVHPILVVVDALDECDVEDAPSIFEGLCRMVQSLPTFRVVLTTRPQPHISNNFAIGHTISLQDIEDKVVDNDIRLYLKHCLSREQVKARLPGLRTQWYASDGEIETLVQAAGKLFIIASTAVLFILDKPARDPEHQMSKLLNTRAQGRTPFRVLNNFYFVILRNAVPKDCDDDIVERYRSVVGTIMVIRTPLSVMSLALLIDRREKEIEAALDTLQSVIVIGDDRVPRIYHKSFLDYVTDPERCKDANLQINVTDRHAWIAVQCFKTMNKHLEYNILGLEGPARFMDNKGGRARQGILDRHLLEKVPMWLRYACVYWATHLEGSNVEGGGRMKELEKFADGHMLHWFEALSLIGELDSAHRSLLIALKPVKPTSSDLFQLLSDGLRFIAKFYDIIEQSALHTYYSALPFTPTESLLYRRYQKEAMNGICRVMNGPKKWDALVAILRHERGSEVEFSVNGTMLAAWDDDRTIKLWDAATGTPIFTNSFYNLPKLCHLAIAGDFSTVASTRGNTITLHSVKNSVPLATFTASTQIRRLALSSESRRVAAWLSDGTICLWDTGNGELIASFGGFESGHSWAIFTFSPTGARFFCVPSSTRILQLRDGVNGALVASLDRLPQWYHKLVFSQDGSRYAVLTEEAPRLCRSKDGGLVGIAMDVPRDISTILAVSCDGSLLATGYRTKVQLWRGNRLDSLVLIDVLDLSSSDIVRYLKFSQGNKLVITTPLNVVIYDIKNCFTIPFPSPGWPTLAFSPDCTRLAVVDDYGRICLWDVQAMKVPGSASNEPRRRLRDLALSQDCTRIACLSEDGAIELWEMGLTKQPILISCDQELDPDRCPLAFSPDGRKFANRLKSGTIGLWDTKDGASIGFINFDPGVVQVAFSNRMLAAASATLIALRDLETLRPVGTVSCSPGPDFDGYVSSLSFSNHGDLLAHGIDCFVTLINVAERTAIAAFRFCGYADDMAFLSNDSQLVAQCADNFQSFSLLNETVTDEPKFDHLIQLSHFPLWHGIPVWLSPTYNLQDRPHLVGLFAQHEDPVPVLWTPRGIRIVASARESSMIALACDDGQLIFIQSSSSTVY